MENPQSNLPSQSTSPARPSAELLAELYRHLPVLVVHLTLDGTVLHCNPEVARVTGYGEAELFGRNFWSVLFPGRLFAQVPKFISAMQPFQAIANDIPMTLRTQDGKERVIAWSRFSHEEGTGSGVEKSIICIGKDLTDRLLDSDNVDQPARIQGKGSIAFGPPIGNVGTVDGDIIMPLAISPPAPIPGENGGAAIQQVHEFLTQIHVRVEAMESAFLRGEIASVAGIAAGLRNGAHACGLLDFSTRAEHLRQAATSGTLENVTSLVQEIVTLCRPDATRKNSR